MHFFKYSLSLGRCSLFLTIKSLTISDAFWYFNDSLFRHWNCHVYKWKYKTHLELNMSTAFLHLLYCIRRQVLLGKRRIQVEKYLRKKSNNKWSVIEIHMLQTIVGNFCQEIYRFNFGWTISFFPAQRTSTYCFFRNKMLLLLL